MRITCWKNPTTHETNVYGDQHIPLSHIPQPFHRLFAVLNVCTSTLSSRWKKLGDTFVNKVQDLVWCCGVRSCIVKLVRRYHFKNVTGIWKLVPDYFSSNSLMHIVWGWIVPCCLNMQLTNSNHCSLTNV